jgi:prevent-host-death family protein
METVPISKFKARCLSILETVRRTRRPIRVTRFGEPVADVVPPALPERPRSWLGSMRTTGRIVGDIVAPTGEDVDWESFRT